VVQEYQCRPHGSDYSMRGLSNMRVDEILDPDTQRLIAIHMRMNFQEMERTIWMDRSPHPPDLAPHTFPGFSTGTWDRNMLNVYTRDTESRRLRSQPPPGYESLSSRGCPLVRASLSRGVVMRFRTFPCGMIFSGLAGFSTGKRFIIYHEPKAHTEGDSTALFRGSDVVSAGDIFTPGGYLFLDLEKGGSVQGEIAALNHILELPVPGHR